MTRYRYRKTLDRSQVLDTGWENTCNTMEEMHQMTNLHGISVAGIYELATLNIDVMLHTAILHAVKDRQTGLP